MVKRFARTMLGVGSVCLVCFTVMTLAVKAEEKNSAEKQWKFSPKYKEWKALMYGDSGIQKDEQKAAKILDQLIKGIYVVKFGPAIGFHPRNAKAFIPVFFKTSALRSNHEQLTIGFLRTTRENNKLIASFLTNQPKQMKQDIEKNPKLEFISMEKMTPEKFIAYDKSRQESLQKAGRDNATSSPRFLVCDNHSGSGFYWIDSTNGKVWKSNLSAKDQNKWKYLGQPEGAKTGNAGSYIPQANKGGGGLFILNTETGEGWWTNGKDWKALGKPEGQ